VTNRRLGIGFVLLILAVLAFGMSRVLADGGNHAYDPEGTPAGAYELTKGRTYQLSTRGGVGDLQGHGVIGSGSDVRCSAEGTDETSTPLTVDASTDDRDLHVFGTFTAPASGRFVVTCEETGPVFVDDANNSERDYPAVLVVLSSALALVAVIAIMSGLYRRIEPDPATRVGPEADRERLA
jgi:Na+-transporting methylmalonyl-CoA/oxaloacetate decarboxylase gamma subunit